MSILRMQYYFPSCIYKSRFFKIPSSFQLVLPGPCSRITRLTCLADICLNTGNLKISRKRQKDPNQRHNIFTSGLRKLKTNATEVINV